MIIGINGNEANVAHRVGIGQIAFELLSHLPKKDIVVYLQSKPLPDMPDLNYEVFGPKKLWTLTGLQKKLLTNPPDVLFSLTHYAPLIVPCKSVVLVTDLGHAKMPEFYKAKDWYQLQYWTWLSAVSAAKIITISQYSKNDICQIYKIKPEKVVVAYPGYDQKRFRPQPKTLTQNYLLYLGTLQPRKNLVRLIEAFAALPDRNLKLKVVGMINEGRGGWLNQDIFAKVEELGLKDRVEFTGYVPDTAVPDLMAKATAYILPSLYEGFGIPAIEAMATGVPVVVSRISCLPEICGDAAIYIDDPTSVASIKDALEKVLSLTPAQRQQRIDLGLKWVKRYNWKDTAKKVSKVLYEVAKG